MKIVWTDRALAEYENVIAYLLDKWTVKEAQKLVRTTESVIKFEQIALVHSDSIF